MRGQEERRAQRLRRVLPVRLDKQTGYTRDISSSGIYFDLPIGDGFAIPISFSIELDTPTGTMMLHCDGEIVRVEPRELTLGVAVKIKASKLTQAKN